MPRGNPGGAPAARGFSLIELLLTLAIILILFVTLYGSGSRSHQSRQKEACRNNLQTIHLALQLYAGDFESRFPQLPGAQTSEGPLSLLVPKYTALTEPFICPGSKDARLPEAEPFSSRRISYAYYMGWRATNHAAPLVTDRQIDTRARNKGDPLFSTDGEGAGANHNKFGGNVLFIDGRVESVPPAAPFPLEAAPGVTLLNPRP